MRCFHYIFVLVILVFGQHLTTTLFAFHRSASRKMRDIWCVTFDLFTLFLFGGACAVPV